MCYGEAWCERPQVHGDLRRQFGCANRFSSQTRLRTEKLQSRPRPSEVLPYSLPSTKRVKRIVATLPPVNREARKRDTSNTDNRRHSVGAGTDRIRADVTESRSVVAGADSKTDGAGTTTVRGVTTSKGAAQLSVKPWNNSHQMMSPPIAALNGPQK